MQRKQWGGVCRLTGSTKCEPSLLGLRWGKTPDPTTACLPSWFSMTEKEKKYFKIHDEAKYRYSSHHEHSDDKTEKADGAGEDLDDEDPDKEGWVRGVGEGGARPHLAHADAAH